MNLFVKVKKRSFLKLIVFSLLIFIQVENYAQRFANEWIKPNQTYFKFKVAKEGIHRIDYFSLTTAVTQAGIQLSALKPNKIQVFHLGIELPIFVEGEADGAFNINDFVEFYATPNDGKLDTKLYPNGIIDQLHDKYSLYGDTGVYFVTFLPDTSGRNGLRSLIYNNTVLSGPKYRYHVASSFAFENTNYHYGVPYALSATDMHQSEYTNGEGYRSEFFGYGSVLANKKIVHLSSNFLENTGFNPTLEFCFMGNNNWRQSNPDHRMKVLMGKRIDLLQEKFDTTFEGFAVINRKISLNLSELDTGLDLSFQVIQNSNYPTQHARFSHAELIYPATFNLNNTSAKKFILEPEFFAPRHVSWTNYKTGYNSPIVYCLNKPAKITASVNPLSECSFMTPQNNSYDTFFICDENDVIFINKLERSALIDFNTHVNKYNYVLVSGKKLTASAEKYAIYRSNGFTPVLVYVEDLYNSFSYGYRHPLSIRNYADFMLEKSDTFWPKHLTLLGKGFQTDGARDLNYQEQEVVPTIGVPGSDNMFTSGLKHSILWEPAIPTGRISAINTKDVDNYLEKLRSYESAGNAYWRKEVMHLGGGQDAGQAGRILNTLNDAKTIVENGAFAGKVITFSRSSKSLIDPDVRNSTIQAFKDGKNLITFLGHGSASVFDLDVGTPDEYRNVGKYPICYFNGCSTGNPFGYETAGASDLSYGLQMMKLAKSGSIVFMAQTNLAEESTVSRQISVFYSEAFKNSYGMSVGEIMKNTIKNTQSASSFLTQSHSRQLLYQGDPAITFFAPNKPEYQITAQHVTLEPSIVSALADSFILRIKIENLGSYGKDSILLHIKRLYPDNITERFFELKLPPIQYEYTINYAIYSKDPSTAGVNKFTIDINPFKTISELSERYDNNRVVKDLQIARNGISLVYPERFAIIEGDSVELIFQPLDLFTQNQQFNVYLDTSWRFDSINSGAFRQTTINEAFLCKWKVKLPNFGKDSVAWYWRANVNIGGTQGGGSVDRSFTNIKNHTRGWCQTEFPQFMQGTPSVIKLDTSNRRFEFINLQKPIWVDMTFNPSGKGVKEGGLGSSDLNFGVGQNRIGFPQYDCPAQGIVLMLWDQYTLDRFLLPGIRPRCYWGSVFEPHSPGDQSANARYQAYYTFDLADAGQQIEFINLVNTIPLNTYITGYSYNSINPSLWTPAVKAAFNSMGCIKTDSITDALTTYVFVGQKGATKGSITEDYVIYDPATNSGYVGIKGTMNGAGSRGWLTSEKIGPVDSWGAVYHWFKTDEPDPTIDVYFVDVYGVKNNGKDTLLKSRLTQSPISISDIDPNIYKFIYLKAHFEDIVNNTAPQLQEWRVTYKPVPEGTIDPGKNFVFHKDTLEEGDSFRFKINFTNISQLNFKPNLSAKYKLFNKEKQTLIDSGRIIYLPILFKDSSFIFDYKHSTVGLNGNYQFELLYNENYEQQEQLLINNAAIFNFFIKKDIINPLLDITFDGRHIINNEIVSPNPKIHIVSKDNNKLLLQNDTNTFTLALKYPNSNSFTDIPITSPNVNFIPATNSSNVAQLDFNPTGLQDGTYTLKVQSRDGSKNEAGSLFYEISFRVINEQSVTNFYPYPNPFSTSMKFVFTLTGNELPQDVRISIMTLSGKVVRQITKNELGQLRIGNNISDFTWDGTDQFGDKLANGVYLYKVDVTDTNGKEMKEADFDAADAQNREKYFKKNIGKIYIMR